VGGGSIYPPMPQQLFLAPLRNALAGNKIMQGKDWI
jgi:hypothetical protein